ncbi:MAG: ribosome assembly RNA-binding protein YhbY [Smithellaceae bacterium]|nr:ribosome assembly RNA-binding protein YhbY [Smithellaceae bacterium]
MEKKLGSLERKYLRGLAHHLKPLIQIGKGGLSEEVISQIEQSLLDHELIKIKFGDFKEEKKELTAAIAEKTGSEAVGIIGNVAILYRPHPEPEKRRVFPPPQQKKGTLRASNPETEKRKKPAFDATRKGRIGRS